MNRNALALSPLEIGPISNPRIFHQLALLLLDGSGSMASPTPALITKAEATDLATRELITRFKAGRSKSCFSFSVIAFDSDAEVRMEPTDLPKIDEFTEDFNPMRNHGGGTDIACALEEAERVATSFFAQAPKDGVPTDCVLLVMSDGEHNSPAHIKSIADGIKATHGGRITICAALFSSVGSSDPLGETILKSIVSDPVRGYSTVYTPEALRDFFTASLVRASGVLLR